MRSLGPVKHLLVAAVVTALLPQLAATGPASAASPTGEVAVFFAPSDAPSAVAEARDALAARLAELGIAWMDRSPAAVAPREAGARLRRGIEAYQGLDFADALAELDAAIAEVAHTGGEGLTASQLSDLFLYRGLARAHGGDAEAAWEDLVRAATIAPARLLDPAQFSPRIVESFERARDALAAAERGTITVTAPERCEIAIDGVVNQAGPLFHGEHHVRVTCAGRRPWGAVVLLAGATVEITADPELEAPPASSEVLALARAGGATGAIAIVASTLGGGAPSLALRRLDARGRVSVAASVALTAGTAAGDALTALATVLFSPAVVEDRDRVAASSTTPWYRRPWVWAIAGAVTAAALIVPLTSGGDGGEVVVLRPSGLPW